MTHPISKAQATLDLARQRKVKSSFSLSGAGAANELSQCLAALDGTHPHVPPSNLFQNQFCILAGATSPDLLPDSIRQINRSISPSGANCVTEGFAAQCSYWSAFPTFDIPHRPFNSSPRTLPPESSRNPLRQAFTDPTGSTVPSAPSAPPTSLPSISNGTYRKKTKPCPTA